MTYRLLDLFSGIGGFSLGLERSGAFKTVAFCEIEPFCRRVLAKHWPGVPCYDDVRTLTADRLRADGIAVDAICGGFPCQDISLAGKGAGLDGERSGLWTHIARLIGELRPSYVIVENVSALLGRGLDRVLGDLAALRYDAQWHCIPASAISAPHRRDRFWLVGHPQSMLSDGRAIHGRCDFQSTGARQEIPEPGDVRPNLADAGFENVERQRQIASGISTQLANVSIAGWWACEPAVGRVAHGVPDRVDRLKALGNAVVPQIPELIGRAIAQAEAA